MFGGTRTMIQSPFGSKLLTSEPFQIRILVLAKPRLARSVVLATEDACHHALAPEMGAVPRLPFSSHAVLSGNLTRMKSLRESREREALASKPFKHLSYALRLLRIDLKAKCLWVLLIAERERSDPFAVGHGFEV